MRFVKFLIGLLLVPVCVIGSQVLWGLLRAAQPASTPALPTPALVLLGGFLFWLLLFSVFPRPVRVYILAHELTHALWGLLMGATVKSMRVQKDRGAVVLSKTNFLITLAPYFFPFYTVMVIVAYGLLGLFFDVSGGSLVWLGLVGATWGFHVTFTVNALLQHQSDIRQQGRMFSYTVIYLANVAGICIWVLCLSGATWRQAGSLFVTHGAAMRERLLSAGGVLIPLAHDGADRLSAMLRALMN